MTLLGKVAIVTGASSGIGASIAVELAAGGATLLLVGRDRRRLDAVAADARVAGAPRAEVLATDVTAPGASAAIADAAARLGEGVDLVVPCAGIFEPEPVVATTIEAFDRHMEINVRAPYELVLAVLPRLRRGGSIVLISSICGSGAFPGAVAYCASKGAIEMLTRALACELTQAGVRVNAVAPGIIRTPLNADQLDGDPAYATALTDRTPLGRIGSPDEVAPAVAFLASDRARFITGATLPIDGGWLAA